MNLDAIPRDERGRADPQSPADCLAHCTAFMSLDDHEMAVLLIELLIHKRVATATTDAVKDTYARAKRIFTQPITAAEVAQAEETPS